jgi:peptidoglycan lytic transglycosylase
MRPLLVLSVLLAAASCSGTVQHAAPAADECPALLSRPATTPPPAPAVPAEPAPAAGPVYRETGTASWYGREFHGRRTAGGEVFDMNGLSAAHRTLPLGTVIRVTNLDNYKSIRLTVNDRGPLVRDRMLDLSYGAARELGFAAQGTARVKIETMEPVADSGTFTVQAAAFTEEENARLLRERLTQRYEVVSIVPWESNIATFYRVRVGSYRSEEKAERIASKLTLEGLEPIVVRKD